MANISCVRAGASCLPFLGPLISVHNVSEIKQRISSMFLMRRALAATQASSGEVSGGVEKTEKKVKEEARLRNIYEEGRIYSVYGIVGNVLSVALLVGLTALGVFIEVNLLLICFPFVIQARLFAHDLERYKEILKDFETPENRI